MLTFNMSRTNKWLVSHYERPVLVMPYLGKIVTALSDDIYYIVSKRGNVQRKNTIYGEFKICFEIGKLTTGRERLIRSHSSARFCFELSGNSN